MSVTPVACHENWLCNIAGVWSSFRKNPSSSWYCWTSIFWWNLLFLCIFCFFVLAAARWRLAAFLGSSIWASVQIWRKCWIASLAESVCSKWWILGKPAKSRMAVVVVVTAGRSRPRSSNRFATPACAIRSESCLAVGFRSFGPPPDIGGEKWMMIGPDLGSLSKRSQMVAGSVHRRPLASILGCPCPNSWYTCRKMVKKVAIGVDGAKLHRIKTLLNLLMMVS